MTDAGVSLDDTFRVFYSDVQRVLRLYGPILIYYVKAHYRDRWESRLGDCRDWTATHVLVQLEKQRDCLDAISANARLYAHAKDVHHGLLNKPETLESRLAFHSAALECISRLPTEELASFDWGDQVKERLDLRQLLTPCLTILKFEMEMSIREMKYHGRIFEEKATSQYRSSDPSMRKTLKRALGKDDHSADSDSEEDELYLRHIVAGESVEAVVSSIKRRKRNKRKWIRANAEA